MKKQETEVRRQKSGADNTALDCWAIIELFGHQRIAGRVKSENLGAACLIRVDVPQVEGERSTWDMKTHDQVKEKFHIAGFTKYFGVASIYSLAPTTEELAREAASQLAAEPVSVFSLESVQRRRMALPEGEED